MSAQVCTESTMCLGRYVSSRRHVGSRVKEDSSFFALDHASFGRWRGVSGGAFQRVTKERTRGRHTPLVVSFATRDFGGLAFRTVCAFELMVSGCLSEQLLD